MKVSSIMANLPVSLTCLSLDIIVDAISSHECIISIASMPSYSRKALAGAFCALDRCVYRSRA